MDEKTNAKELRTIIDSISTDSVIKAIEIMNIIRKYGIYPSGKIQDICNQLPGLGMPNDYPITEIAFMFALGQAYQTQNSKVLNLFVEDLIKEYSSANLRYKECYNNAENHYEKAIYEGLVTSTSNIIFDLKKKLSEFG